MLIPDPRWLLAATGPSEARPSPPPPWWQRAFHALSVPAWATLLAAVVGFGLLVSFQQVVAKSVLQAEQRRTAMAAQDRKLWRCNLLPAGAGRDQCLALSREAPGSMPSGGTAPLSSTPWRTE